MLSLDPYRETAYRIAVYLASRQEAEGAFPGPDHYGIASAVWLWSHFGQEMDQHLERAMARLSARPPQTHGEFNAYALLSCRDRVRPGLVDLALRRLKFGRRHSANWMLLRATCRAKRGSWLEARRGWLGARAALALAADDGFIADRPGVRSFAYHCFSGALLADLWGVRGYRWAAAAAVRAARFIAPFILPNGDALYVGRGQQQIFGYGALIWLLEAAAAIAEDRDLRHLADRVFGHLLAFRRDDGSFPLVLNEEEPAEPWLPQPHAGWYSYNRYADYLPFFAGMLLKAAEAAALPSLGGEHARQAGLSPSAQTDYRIHREPRYTAVLSRPGGASTNDLAFPYVCLDRVSIFPCYGAEGPSKPEASPLPYGVLARGRRYAFRDQLHYRLTESGLVGESPLVRHARDFEFGANGFTCRDEIVFRRACSFSDFVSANYLFRNLRPASERCFETSYRGVRAEIHPGAETAISPGVTTTASGRLCALRSAPAPLAARPFQRLSVELEVRFL